MKEERSKIKSDILLRVRLLYVLFILAGAVVLGRLVWVQLFSSEVAYNAERLASRIFPSLKSEGDRHFFSEEIQRFIDQNLHRFFVHHAIRRNLPVFRDVAVKTITAAQIA